MKSRLLEWRTKRGYTQQQLSSLANVTMRQYAKWEQAKARPNVEYALRLARLLECRVEDIFEENGEK